MSRHYTYLAINIGSFIIPLLFSFHPKLLFYKKWKAFAQANILVTSIFIAWDILYTHLGVWGFNPNYLVGITIANLPLEEILFFIFIPFSSIYTYHCLKVFFPNMHVIPYKWISFLLSVSLIMVGITHPSKLYTSVTFILLALTILVLTFRLKLSWLPNFYFSYLVILLPFFVVNGILTGTGIDAPIVWYDDTQNLGIRILTIPVEDIFYGMLLLILNTSLYEYFDRKNTA